MNKLSVFISVSPTLINESEDYTMRILRDYIQYLTDKQLNAVDALWGYVLELAIKDYYGLPLVISPAGKTDIRAVIDGHLRLCESKQNGGDFRTAGKGNSYMMYSVYVDLDADLRHQFGYVMPMRVFRECGYALNHIRSEKSDHNGLTKMSLQTLYVYKQGDFLGKKAFKLADLWEENGAVPFKEFFK
jgi:hypothetical protein